MCVDKLICKEKVSCIVSGTYGEVVFSGIGFMSEPVCFVAVLLNTIGSYTMTLQGQTITKQGSGVPEFCVLKDLELISPNIYSLSYTSSEPLRIYELNFATRCLCNPDDC